MVLLQGSIYSTQCELQLILHLFTSPECTYSGRHFQQRHNFSVLLCKILANGCLKLAELCQHKEVLLYIQVGNSGCYFCIIVYCHPTIAWLVCVDRCRQECSGRFQFSFQSPGPADGSRHIGVQKAIPQQTISAQHNTDFNRPTSIFTFEQQGSHMGIMPLLIATWRKVFSSRITTECNMSEC